MLKKLDGPIETIAFYGLFAAAWLLIPQVLAI